MTGNLLFKFHLDLGHSAVIILRRKNLKLRNYSGKALLGVLRGDFWGFAKNMSHIPHVFSWGVRFSCGCLPFSWRGAPPFPPYWGGQGTAPCPGTCWITLLAPSDSQRWWRTNTRTRWKINKQNQACVTPLAAVLTWGYEHWYQQHYDAAITRLYRTDIGIEINWCQLAAVLTWGYNHWYQQHYDAAITRLYRTDIGIEINWCQLAAVLTWGYNHWYQQHYDAAITRLYRTDIGIEINLCQLAAVLI